MGRSSTPTPSFPSAALTPSRGKVRFSGLQLDHNCPVAYIYIDFGSDFARQVEIVTSQKRHEFLSQSLVFVQAPAALTNDNDYQGIAPKPAHN